MPLDLTDIDTCSWLVLDAAGRDAEFAALLASVIDVDIFDAASRERISDAINAGLRSQYLSWRIGTDGKLHPMVLDEAAAPYAALGVMLSQPHGLRTYARCQHCQRIIVRMTRHFRRYCDDSCRAQASQARQRRAL